MILMGYARCAGARHDNCLLAGSIIIETVLKMATVCSIIVGHLFDAISQ